MNIDHAAAGPSQAAAGSSEDQILLAVLSAVESDAALTQRRLAQELGIALGLANRYLKRCWRLGLIKISHAPPHRYCYYLTPQGFTEKSRLTARYLRRSFDFYREARAQVDRLLGEAAANSWRRIVLFGASELGEIAVLCARRHAIELKGFVDEAAAAAEFAGLPLTARAATLGKFDAALLTDLQDPQSAFDRLRQSIPLERILAPALLGVGLGARVEDA